MHCNFCGKHQDYVFKLIVGWDYKQEHKVVICDECVDMCAEILREDREDRHKNMK